MRSVAPMSIIVAHCRPLLVAGLLACTGVGPALGQAGDWPRERQLEAYGAGLLLGGVSACSGETGQRLASARALLEAWVQRDISDPQAQQALTRAVASGHAAGERQAAAEPESCHQWVDDFARVESSLQLRAEEVPPPSR